MGSFGDPETTSFTVNPRLGFPWRAQEILLLTMARGVGKMTGSGTELQVDAAEALVAAGLTEVGNIG